MKDPAHGSELNFSSVACGTGAKVDAAGGFPPQLAARGLLNLLDEAALLLDAADLQILEVSSGVERLLGYRDTEVRGRSFFSMVAGGSRGAAARSLRRRLAAGENEISIEADCRLKAGGRLSVDLTLRRLEGTERLIGAVLRSHSANGFGEIAATPFGTRDSLTGLPNRSCWDEQLSTAMRRAAADPELMVAVLFVDLDHFKRVNDAFGHPVGDGVLRIAAQRLVASVRPTDIVARFGGDEFVVLFEGAPEPYQLVEIAKRICKSIRAPMQLGPRQLVITASVGVKIASTGIDSPARLVAAADRAMYQAKARGREFPGLGQWIVDGGFTSDAVKPLQESLEKPSSRLRRCHSRREATEKPT